MKALTWKEPFATLMLHGKIETRTWNTNYRGMVLICAGKTPYSDVQLLSISGPIQLSRIQPFIHKEKPGFAIGVGKLIDCRPMLPTDQDKCFVKYDPLLFCHIYDNVRAIEPFPWKGTQGWSDVPQTIIRGIKYLNK